MSEIAVLLLALLFFLVVLALVFVSFKTPGESMSVQLGFVKFSGPIIAFPAVVVGIVLLVFLQQSFAG